MATRATRPSPPPAIPDRGDRGRRPSPGSGYPGPGARVPPRRPQRPGPVITSAVLAFVQAGVVLIASLYLWFFTSMIGLAARDNPAVFGSSRMEALTTEATVLAVVQVLSVALLIGAGVRALSARTRGAWLLLVVAHAVQVGLAGYWAVRLTTVVSDLPGVGVDGTPAAFTLLFAAAPAVGLGLVLFGAGRRWFESPHHP